MVSELPERVFTSDLSWDRISRLDHDSRISGWNDPPRYGLISIIHGIKSISDWEANQPVQEDRFVIPSPLVAGIEVDRRSTDAVRVGLQIFSLLSFVAMQEGWDAIYPAFYRWFDFHVEMGALNAN